MKKTILSALYISTLLIVSAVSADFYTTSQILNKVLVDQSLGVVGSTYNYTTDQAFNIVFSTTSNALAGTISTPSVISNLNSITLSTTAAAPTYKEGTLYWDATDKTLAVQTGLSDTTLQVGQESYIRGRNNTGSILQNGSLVYITGRVGNRPTFGLAVSSIVAKAEVCGMLTEEIGINSDGFATTMGLVRGINLSAYGENDTLYLSSFTAGGYTNYAPPLPNYAVKVGNVALNTNNGAAQIGLGIDQTNHVTANYLSAISSFTSLGNTYLATSSGNVGIGGITSPSAKLSFGQLANTPLIHLWDSPETDNYGMGIRPVEMQLFVPSSAHFSFNSGGSLQISGTNELMRITGGGNVGIGTTTPASKLNVIGSVTASTSAITPQINALDANGLKLYDDSTNGIFIQDGGNVGIGATNPIGKLQVGDGFNIQLEGVYTNNGYFYTNLNHNLDYATGKTLYYGKPSQIVLGGRGEVIFRQSISLYNAGETVTDYRTPITIGENGIVYLQKTNSPNAALQTLYSTNTITTANDFALVVSSGGSVDVSNITAGSNGDIIEIMGTSDTNIVNFIEGGNMQLAGGTSFALGLGDNIAFRWYGSYWYEKSRSNN